MSCLSFHLPYVNSGKTDHMAQSDKEGWLTGCLGLSFNGLSRCLRRTANSVYKQNGKSKWPKRIQSIVKEGIRSVADKIRVPPLFLGTISFGIIAEVYVTHY